MGKKLKEVDKKEEYVMSLAFLGFAMIVVFMALIMAKN